MLDFIVGNWILLIVPVGTIIVVGIAFAWVWLESLEYISIDEAKKAEKDTRI